MAARATFRAIQAEIQLGSRCSVLDTFMGCYCSKHDIKYTIIIHKYWMNLARMILFSKRVFEFPCKRPRHVWQGSNFFVQHGTGRSIFPNLIYKIFIKPSTLSDWFRKVKGYWLLKHFDVDACWLKLLLIIDTFYIIWDLRLKIFLLMMQRWPCRRWSMSLIHHAGLKHDEQIASSSPPEWHHGIIRPSLQLFSTAAAALCHAWSRQMIGRMENFMKKIPWEGGM